MIRDQIKDLDLSIRKISAEAREQEDCVRFDIGQPSFDTPSHVKEAVIDGLENKQGYTPTKGFDELRELVAQEEMLTKSVKTSKENILITTGGMEALHTVFSTVLTPEDTVLLNDPHWGPYEVISTVNGNDFKHIPFFTDNGVNPSLRKELNDATMMVVNTPSNPTGRVITATQAKRLGEMAKDTDTFLLSDEVYHRLTYNTPFHSPATHAEHYAIIGSTSKSHAMTGWRLGWVNAPESLITSFTKASRATTACPPRASQYAGIRALNNDDHVAKMRATYEERRDIVCDRISRLGWELEQPNGGMYAFPDVKEDSWTFCMDMIEAGVAMIPGEPMGSTSATNVRICYGSTSKEEIRTAFNRIEDAYEE